MTASLDLRPRHAECRSCKASIVWARSTATDQPMPVDYNADAERGTVQLFVDRGQLVAAVLADRQLTGARAAGIPLRTSHFATCPHADHHRRTR